MRIHRIVAIAGCALALGAIAQIPASANHRPRPTPRPRANCTAYPPVNCADFAATNIITAQPWDVGQSNDTFVRVENHGDLGARGQTTLIVRAPQGVGTPIIHPRRVNLSLAAGDSALVLFDVEPQGAGNHRATACASARNPVEGHRADDCVGATIAAA